MAVAAKTRSKNSRGNGKSNVKSNGKSASGRTGSAAKAPVHAPTRAKPGSRWRRLMPSGSFRGMEHVKVLFAFLIWFTLVRQQALLMVDWQLYYAQALVATAALAVGSLMVVYMYPPRTARWRTVAWTFLASSMSGALVYAALGGRAGLLGALLGGALVLWARAEERGRRAVRRVRRSARRP